MTTTIETQSVTYTYAPEGGDPKTLTFDQFIPENITRPRIDVIAEYVDDIIIASGPKNVIISPIEYGAKQLTDAVMDKVSERELPAQPQKMPIRVKRYHGTEAAAELTVEKDFDITPGALEGKTVIIIDEVVDAAIAAEWAINRARELGAKMVIFVTLANKPNVKGRRQIKPDLFVIGFDDIDEEVFLLGWGMDWHEQGRELKAIYRVRDGKTATYSTPDLPDLLAAISATR